MASTGWEICNYKSYRVYIQRTDFGKEERKFKDILSISDGYSIPYSPKKVDEIRSIGIPLDGKQAYMVETANGIKISVKSYKSFRDGDFDELAHFRQPYPFRTRKKGMA